MTGKNNILIISLTNKSILHIPSYLPIPCCHHSILPLLSSLISSYLALMLSLNTYLSFVPWFVILIFNIPSCSFGFFFPFSLFFYSFLSNRPSVMTHNQSSCYWQWFYMPSFFLILHCSVIHLPNMITPFPLIHALCFLIPFYSYINNNYSHFVIILVLHILSPFLVLLLNFKFSFPWISENVFPLSSLFFDSFHLACILTIFRRHILSVEI